MKVIIKYSLVWGATIISICGLTVGMAKPVGEIKPTVIAQQSAELEEFKRLLQQADQLSKQGKYSEAIPLLKLALTIAQNLGSDDYTVAFVLNLLGQQHYYQGRYTEAESLHQRALAIAEQSLGADHPLVASTLNNLASLYNSQGKYREAELLYQRTLAIEEKVLGADHPKVAIRLNNLANVYLQQGKYREAEPIYQRALAIDKKALGTNHPNFAQTLNNLGELYHNQARYSEAQSFFQQALAIREKALGTEHPLVASSLNNLASLYYNQGKYKEADPLFQRAIAVQEKALGTDHPDIAKILNSLGSLYHSQGRYKETEPIYQRALEIAEKALGADHSLVATSLHNLATLYHDIRHPEAEAIYKRALAINEKAFGVDHPYIATSLNSLASLYHDQGRYSEAEPIYQRALAINQKALGTDHPYVANNLHNLAVLYNYQQRYTQAEPIYQGALAINEKALGTDHPYVALTLNNLATLYQAQGNISRAIEFFTRTMEVQETTLTTYLATGSESQKQASMRKLSGSTNQTISLHLQDAPNNPDAANLALTTILRRKGRILESLTDSLQTIRDNLTPENQKLLDDLATTRTLLAALIYNKPKNLPLEQYRQQVAILKGKAEKLEADLSLASATFSTTSQPITIETVKQLIPSDAALVEIIQYYPYNVKANKFKQPHYAAYILHSAGKPQWVDLGVAKPIHKAVAEFRYALSRPDTSPQQIARTLDQQVMQPIRQKLGNAKHILLSPDSQLNLIPFAALVDENNQYLIQNYNITYLTTGRDLIKLEINFPTKQPPVLVANPEYDTPGNPTSTQLVASNNRSNNKRATDLVSLKVGALPGTKAEAAAIAPMLSDVTVLTESNATENAIKQVKAPEILHIATHGFFLEDVEEVTSSISGRGGLIVEPDFNASIRQPIAQNLENPLLRSGIALAGFNPRQSGNEDGVMTALEIANLSLGGTKLVVLSACETGVGDVNVGEGVYGLRRALAIAGSESQVISLWKVDDFGTKELMVKYYQRVLNNEGRSEAMRQTQLEMLGTEGYQHPFYWASFIPSGEWREMGI